MISQEKITQVIFNAIDDLNQLLPRDRRLEKSQETVLSGPVGGLDSLGLINLIVATEQKIQEELNVAISLADGKAMALPYNPFESIGTLAGYISVILKDKDHGK